MTIRSLIGVAILLAMGGAAASDGWMSDLDEAIEVAQRDGRHLLVDFTGSDWCPPCRALEQEVLSDPGFVTKVLRTHVLVTVDFPKRKPLPKDQRRRNDAWAREFSVTGYPTVVMMTPELVEYGRLSGFRRGAGKEFRAWVFSKTAHSKDIGAALATLQLDANGDEVSDADLVKAAEHLVTLLGADTPSQASEVLRRLDPEDEGLGRARLELARFEAKFSGQPGQPDWRAMLKSADSAAATTPSIERLGDLHAWRALAHQRCGDGEAARACLVQAKMREARPELLEWVQAILDKAAR